jgi:hypothetical protein
VTQEVDHLPPLRLATGHVGSFVPPPNLLSFKLLFTYFGSHDACRLPTLYAPMHCARNRLGAGTLNPHSRGVTPLTRARKYIGKCPPSSSSSSSGSVSVHGCRRVVLGDYNIQILLILCSLLRGVVLVGCYVQPYFQRRSPPPTHPCSRHTKRMTYKGESMRDIKLRVSVCVSWGGCVIQQPLTLSFFCPPPNLLTSPLLGLNRGACIHRKLQVPLASTSSCLLRGRAHLKQCTRIYPSSLSFPCHTHTQ